MRNWLPDLRTLHVHYVYILYICAISCVFTYVYMYTYVHVCICIHCLARDASRYFFENASHFAITYLCVEQPFIFFRDLQYMTQQRYSNGAFTEIQIRFATRAVYHLSLFWFKTYRRVSSRGVSWSGDWLQIFIFSLSFSSTGYALFPCLAYVLMKPVQKF